MQTFRSNYLAYATCILALPATPAFAYVHHLRHKHAYSAEAQTVRDFQTPQQGPFSPSLGGAPINAAGVPQSLIDRVIRRESGGNPRAMSHGNYGLMQIRLATARAMGYSGSAAGLLDPQTNMTYAVRYLAGAYRAAGGNEARAIALYSRGYYYEAKRQGFSP